MSSLIATLSAVCGRAFADAGFDAAFGAVKLSDRPDLAQFQCNGALAAAKAAKANPRALAESVKARLAADPRFAAIEIAGPGFLNLTLTDAALGAALQAAATPRAGVETPLSGKRVVIDFGGPNVAKTMHVGHLRSTVIGDALQRLYRFLGADVTSDVHLGDWGKQMGLLIAAVQRHAPHLPYFDAASAGPYPDASPVTMDDLEALYPAAAAAAKEDPAADEAARIATAELQAGRPGYRALWRHFVAVSRAGLEREFGALGVRFDLWKGESDVDGLIPGMVEDLKGKSLAVPDQGALVIHVAKNDDKRKIPPLIVVSRDGSAQYATTDLATIIDRVRTLTPDLVLYVVGQPQHEHFEKVFRAALLAGYAGGAVLEHVGFGTVNGPDGKPFRTRAGGTVKLHDLIAMAKAEALTRLTEAGLAADYPAEEREEIARQVGLAAIKFADLQNHRYTDYIFDLARFVKFEGKTGPYLQYTAVRIRSLLRKAESEGARPGAAAPSSQADRDLALKLLTLPEAFLEAEERRAPNVLCDAAFELAQSYSRFYAAHHILSEADPGLRGARLALSAMTLTALESLLGVLGIEVPTRM